jgi:hypothetical protein
MNALARKAVLASRHSDPDQDALRVQSALRPPADHELKRAASRRMAFVALCSFGVLLLVLFVGR